MNGRPRIPTDDARLARRRAQYRNAKARKEGRPLEPLPVAADVRAWHRRPPRAPRMAEGTQIVRHVVTGEWVAVTMPEAR